MSWIAVATVAGSVIGGMSSQSAANTQANAANSATDLQRGIYDNTYFNLQPFVQQGQTSLGQLNSMMSTEPGGLLHSFNNQDLNSNLSPNYQFQLGQGLGATENSASAAGGLVGGNALKGINDYAQNFAGNAYQQAFNNYTTNQGNIYSRLGNLAQLGQNSATNAASGGSMFGQGMASTIVGAGNAQAAGQIGTANAITGGINQGLGYYQLNQLLANNGAGNMATATNNNSQS